MAIDRRPVVVGFDGSDSADQVLMWAIDDARTRHAPVHVVHAFGALLAYGSMALYGDLPIPDSVSARASSEDLVAGAVRRAAHVAPDLAISGTVIDGDPVTTLLGLVSTASTLVLGSRRLGALGSVVLGSVSATVSARASCPVVVVRCLGACRGSNNPRRGWRGRA